MEDNECQPLETDETKEICVGQVVHSLEEAYNLYQEHAFKMGFSVRKGRMLYYDSEKKNIRLKDFYCSKQGFKNNEREGEVAYERGDSRTNCKAMVRFSVTKDGVWKVTKLVMDHNHDFVPPQQRHLLRSMRKLSEGGLIKSIVNGDIKVTNVRSYLGEEVGGVDELGITMKDVHNHVYTEKPKLIEAGDAQSLLNQLQSRQAQDAMFYYSVQLDQESRLTNVFWRDGKSKVDYDCFGDVVVFDTTYRTNKYNLICAPFVGVNHHWQNVMFGCALLSDETSASFTWLFKVFLESMGNKQPKTIFTDQDAAMGKAIEEVMPNTIHQLCLSHVAKTAPSHLGNLNSNHKFQSLFRKCMSGCDSKEEFESTWNEMVNEYQLHDHQWLSSMFKIRHKWSTAYSKGVFSADIESSQRSESKNSLLGEIAGKTTTLTQFVLAFEKMVKKWRQLEAEKEFKNSQSMPPRIINISETLRHASMIYTHKIFKLFLNEYLDGTGGSTSIEISVCDDVSNHEVTLNHMPNKKHVVAFDSSTLMINCNCQKFSSMGILCSHALRIYNIKGILRIPDQYFLKRWSKNARSVIYDRTHKGSKEDSSSNCIDSMTTGDDAGILYHHAILKSLYNLVLESQGHKETQQIMWNLLDVGVERVHQHINKQSLNSSAIANENTSPQNEDDEHVTICNPLSAETEGMSGAHKKGHFEKRKRSTTKAKQNKEQRKEENFCTVGSSMVEPSSVPHASVAAPLKVCKALGISQK
ncbi:protein FAR1-RELATED SEQUENCE 5-like isoform X2 [Lotus japonicus]|uniref:protein FAR1-RELATED SEQUENCE 5-like isoform X2 n=1 Tax=Lotus japonicus TaxID=34305 RepID=UPI00258A1B83|nr:protein FAR1-RELATED SEQUENCE 5-like isoform X2 [Lotus japonicus]